MGATEQLALATARGWASPPSSSVLIGARCAEFFASQSLQAKNLVAGGGKAITQNAAAGNKIS